MIYVIIIAISIIIGILFKYYSNVDIKNIILSIILSSILSSLIIFIIKYNSSYYTEYWGSYVVNIYENEPYNEWVSQTCTETTTDSDGNTTTTYYDCSYQNDIGPSWVAVTNLGKHINISEKQYEAFKSKFGNNAKIVKTIHNHSSNSRCSNSKNTKFEGKRVGKISYVYECAWPNTYESLQSYTSSHKYENKIKSSDFTVFNLSKITDEEADSLGLYEYPNILDNFNYPTILSHKEVKTKIQEHYQKLNAIYGPKNQLRLWVLIFDDKPIDYAYKQESYWVKGNKNELVICIGKRDDKITWSYIFSWATSIDLSLSIRNYIYDLREYKDTTIYRYDTILNKIPAKIGKKIKERVEENITKKDSTYKIPTTSYPVLTDDTYMVLHKYLNENLNKFQRREFKEFDYIKLEFSFKYLIIIILSNILINIITSFVVINYVKF